MSTIAEALKSVSRPMARRLQRSRKMEPMADVYDVAAYVLKSCGEMTAMKLQKLVYYSQAWSLVWDESPLFADDIEAWANGPVVPNLYQLHKGQFVVSALSKGNAKGLSRNQQETVDAIISHYGNKSASELSELTHREDPWRNARRGFAPGERCSNVISHAAMAEYYEGLYRTDPA